MLPLVVQIVTATGCQVDSGYVFSRACAQCLVVLGWIYNPPATQMEFKQKHLQLLVWVPLPVAVCTCHRRRLFGKQKVSFEFSTEPQRDRKNRFQSGSPLLVDHKIFKGER